MCVCAEGGGRVGGRGGGGGRKVNDHRNTTENDYFIFIFIKNKNKGFQHRCHPYVQITSLIKKQRIKGKKQRKVVADGIYHPTNRIQ